MRFGTRVLIAHSGGIPQPFDLHRYGDSMFRSRPYLSPNHMAQRFAHTLTPRSTSVAAGAAVWLAAGQTIAQSPAELDALLNKTTHIVRTEMAPVIDGALDEDAWESAVRVDDFYESQPDEYVEASEYTEFLLMYDEDNLYIGIRASDSEPELVLATDLRQGDRYTQGDWAGVMIDPFNNKRSGFWFGINPNNVRLDGIFENPTQRLWDWEGIYFARARLTDQGWEGELSIPFKTLSFDPEIETWGMNFGRSVRRRNERINWMSRNQDCGPSAAGEVTGFSGMNQGLGLDIIPSIGMNRRRNLTMGMDSTSVDPSLDYLLQDHPFPQWFTDGQYRFLCNGSRRPPGEPDALQPVSPRKA